MQSSAPAVTGTRLGTHRNPPSQRSVPLDGPWEGLLVLTQITSSASPDAVPKEMALGALPATFLGVQQVPARVLSGMCQPPPISAVQQSEARDKATVESSDTVEPRGDWEGFGL